MNFDFFLHFLSLLWSIPGDNLCNFSYTLSFLLWLWIVVDKLYRNSASMNWANKSGSLFQKAACGNLQHHCCFMLFRVRAFLVSVELPSTKHCGCHLGMKIFHESNISRASVCWQLCTPTPTHALTCAPFSLTCSVCHVVYGHTARNKYILFVSSLTLKCRDLISLEIFVARNPDLKLFSKL